MTRKPLDEESATPLPHVPVAWCPCHGGDPFAKGGGFSFNPMQRACIILGGKPVPTCPKVAPTVPSPPPSPPWDPVLERLEEGHAIAVKSKQRKEPETSTTAVLGPSPLKGGEPMEPQGVRRQRVCAMTIRVCAWMLHAMIDGMVLASAPSTYVLVATAIPVTVCALQDVAAFTVTMASLGASSRRSLTAAVVALSCAFPIGALTSHAVLENAASETAVNVVRAVVAGVFTYMALFELAPPHTHSRAANACYLLCFTCGAAIACVADVVEQLTAEEPVAIAVVEALKQLAPNATLE